jgi:hypothetical protein
MWRPLSTIVGCGPIMIAAASVVFGAVMAGVTQHASWLWFCAPVVIFLGG